MFLLTNKKFDAMQLQLKALQTNALASVVANFNTRIFPNWSVVKEMDAYQTMNQIYCVVKKLATCSALIPFYGFDKKGEDLSDSDALVTFLATLDFEEKEKLYTYLYLNGEVCAYKNRTELGVNATKVQSLTFLHPSRISIQISNDFPRQVVGYSYFDIDTGASQPIALDDMLFIKFFNPSTNTVDEFRGLSPVKVLARVLSTIRSSEDAIVGQLQNGGTPGIVYDKFNQAEVGVTGNRKNDFSKFLLNPANKGAPYFAGNELGYISLGTPLADMEVMELAGLTSDQIYNAFGVSSVWFNNKDASTESNVQEMIKEAYTNTIIPNVYRVEGALNKGVVPDIKTLGTIKCDVSEIKSLQEDQGKLVTALAAAWWLTPNEKRAAQMYDQADDEIFDKFLVPSGLMIVDELDVEVPDVTDTAGEYANVVPLKRMSNG